MTALQGMTFQGMVYADAVLMFSLWLAPKIFNVLADALLQILKYST